MEGTVYVFFADGFEEIEALATVDILRRAGIPVKMVSVTPDEIIRGAHHMSLFCDVNFENCDFADAEMLVLPGGMPGAESLSKHSGLQRLLVQFARENKKIAAICAAPMALGKLGLLKGRHATCYPGFESFLEGAVCSSDLVVVDGNITTGKGPGAALEFGLSLVAQLVSTDKAKELREGMCLI